MVDQKNTFLKDLEFLSNIKLAIPIRADLIDYEFTKTIRRKRAFQQLLKNGFCTLESLVKFFNQKRDLRYFINDIVIIHEVAKSNLTHVWLVPEWVEDQDLHIQKKEGA